MASGLRPWLKEVEKSLSGQVKIRCFNPNAIRPVSETVTSIENGASDHVRTTGRFPLHDVFPLPLLTDSSVSQGGPRDACSGPPSCAEGNGLRQGTRLPERRFHAGHEQIHARDLLEDMKLLRRVSASLWRAPSRLWARPASPCASPDIDMTLSRNCAELSLFFLPVPGSLKIQALIRRVALINHNKDIPFTGINVFAPGIAAKDIPISGIFQRIIPFPFAMMFLVFLPALFPQMPL